MTKWGLLEEDKEDESVSGFNHKETDQLKSDS